MSKKILKALLITFLIIGFASPGFTQRQTGALTGKIVDEDNSPLPGVAITISSPALLGTRDFVSIDTGSFRFPALPPGTYTITCNLPGFKKVIREGIIISVGKTITITMILQPSPIEEEVTVVGEAPVVDVKSTKLSVIYTIQLLDNIPMGRNLDNVLGSVPGSIGGGADQTSVHGSPVSDNRFAVDGVDMTDPMINFPVTNISFDLYEEIEISTGAHQADVGNVSGAYVNIVTRSGGNKFHGRASLYYYNESMVDRNFSDEQLDSFGISSPSMGKNETDFSVNLGGPILKDKLWFFLSGRSFDWARLVTNFPEDVTRREYFGFGKLTFQATKNIKLMGYFNYVDVDVPYNGAGATVAPEATLTYSDNSKTVSGQLSWILSPNAFIDVRGMWVNKYRIFAQKPGTTAMTTDRGTGMTTGAGRFSEDWNWGRFKVSSALTLFLDNFFGGNHELKIGGEYERPFADCDCWMNENYPYWAYTWNGSPYYLGGNMGLIVPFGFGSTQREGPMKVDISQSVFYVQDNWTIKDRLTFNLGLRYGSAHGTLPAQFSEEVTYWMWLDPDFFREKEYPEFKDIIVFNTLSPRLGLAFDVFGNGKTVTKASFGRYFDYLQGSFFWYANPNGYSWQQYIWTDNNLNGTWDPADTFIKIFESGRQDVDPKELYDPNLTCPYWDEFIVGVDHELMPNFRIGVSYIYKHHKKIFHDVEVNRDQNWASQYTVTDPGYDGVFGTGDDAQLTVWDRTAPFEGLYHTNPEEAWRKYQALEIVFEKRMSNKWQLFGSIVYSKMYGTVGGAHASSYGTGSPFDTPNWMINREGRLDFDRPLVIKMQGTHQLPYGLNLSYSFIHSSGSAWTRSVSVWVPNLGSYVGVNAEPQGSRRSSSWNHLDLRLEKEFAFGDFYRLGLFLDVFNALNTATVYSRISHSGTIEAGGSFTKAALWDTVSGVSVPRSVKLGLRFTF